MMENRKDWEGQIVAGQFPLMEYLGGRDASAVFATATVDRSTPQTAIKLIRADSGDADDRLRDLESAAGLSHPNLVRLFQAGRCRLNGVDWIYVVMERADEALAQVLAQRELSPAEALELLDPALDALAYLHARGLVHGRVRPSNLLAAGDTLKLSCDGLCATGQPRRHPEPLDVYDAPETADAGLRPSADVWSLGVTLVEAATRRPSARPPQLPAPLSDIARGCLERDPARRWTVARIHSRLNRSGASSGRRWRTAALAGVLLAAAAIVAGPKLARRTPEPAPPVAVEPLKPQPSDPPVAVAQPPAQGGVLQQVLPDLLPGAQRGIRGRIKVVVKLHVNGNGAVTDAELVSRGPSRYFAGKALEAARQWTFKPPVPSEWLLHFEFDRGAIKVRPEPVNR